MDDSRMAVAAALMLVGVVVAAAAWLVPARAPRILAVVTGAATFAIGMWVLAAALSS
jgi:hypothetical protein